MNRVPRTNQHYPTKRASDRTVSTLPDTEIATGPGRTKLPHSLLQRWIAKGITNHAELARLCLTEAGVSASRQAILYWRRQYDDTYETRQPSAVRRALVPWTVAVEHGQDRLYRALLTEARRRDPGLPDQTDPGNNSRRTQVHAQLLDGPWVIDYSREAGFRLVRPRPGIDLDWIREPDENIGAATQRPIQLQQKAAAS